MPACAFAAFKLPLCVSGVAAVIAAAAATPFFFWALLRRTGLQEAAQGKHEQ